jgi:hypothetical protein
MKTRLRADQRSRSANARTRDAQKRGTPNTERLIHESIGEPEGNGHMVLGVPLASIATAQVVALRRETTTETRFKK